MPSRRWLAIVVVLVSAAVTAHATPSDEELLPLVIPSTTAASSQLAQALHDACEAIASQSQKVSGITPTAPFSVAPIQAWSVKKTGSKDKEIAKQIDTALASAAALGKACDAVRGNLPFDDQILASLREFAKDPATTSALVKTLMVEGTVTPQSLIDLSSFIPTGSLEQALISGLATFIYKRAKAEAFAFVADRLNGLLCTDERKPIFRNLCVAFEDLDTTVSLSAIGSYLAAAARKDLQRLPDVLLVYALNELTTKTGCADKSACEALTAGRVALAFYDEVADGRRPLDVARSLHTIAFTNLQKRQAPKVTRAVRLASEIVDAITRQAGWDRIDQGGVGELPFFALAALFSLEEIRNGNATSCPAAAASKAWCVTSDMLNNRAVALLTSLGSFVRRAAEAHARMNEIVRSLEQPAAPATDQPFEDAKPQALFSRADLARAASATLNLTIEIAVDLGPLLGKVSAGHLETAARLARLGEAIASGKAEATLALEALQIYVRLVGKPASGSAATIAAGAKQALPVVAQLAQAQSADEVVRILEAAAAPVGAYKQKARKQTISLTAFAGATVSAEKISGTPWGSAFGIFAPVGVHASWPMPGNKGNVGLLFAVLNVGNLVSQRLDGDLERTSGGTTTTVDPAQSDDFMKVFSPGLFGTLSMYGPFSAGLGVQLVPSARDVTEMTNGSSDQQARAALQVMAFIGIDVTIFSL